VPLRSLVARLERFYGVLSVPPRDPFACFVWEVLSARTTTGRREQAFGALRRIRALTPDSLARAAPGRLAAAVALAGPHAEDRLQALRVGAEAFRRTPALAAALAGPARGARRALRALPRLGPAGSRRLLLFAADAAVLPPDPDVLRIGRRLEPDGRAGSVSGARTVHRAMREQVRSLDPSAIRRAFVYLSHHAATTCTERDPHCRVCPLLDGCPEGGRRVVTPA
jgi:endonuclease III